MPDRKINFCSKFAVKTLTGADADIFDKKKKKKKQVFKNCFWPIVDTIFGRRAVAETIV